MKLLLESPLMERVNEEIAAVDEALGTVVERYSEDCGADALKTQKGWRPGLRIAIGRGVGEQGCEVHGALERMNGGDLIGVDERNVEVAVGHAARGEESIFKRLKIERDDVECKAG